MTDDRPPELALISLARARFCERLCPLAHVAASELDAFLVGLLSALDAMVGRPLPELLQEIVVSPQIDAALLRQDTPLGRARALVVAYEAGAWDEVTTLAGALGVPERELPALADESRAWATATMPR
jgi:EAL and modified HD-GYP domain-containing signal transduction protein